MKKILAILMAALMLFSCTALAETVQFVEGSNDFDITVEIADDVEYVLFASEGGIPMAHFQKEGGAHVFVSIQASEQYDGNLKDLPDEEREALINGWMLGCSDTIDAATEITPKGNMYVHLHTPDNTNVEQLYTLYAGYIICFALYPVNGAPTTEADHDFMMQLFYDLDIVPVVG